MTLLAEAGAAPQTAHAEPASRADVAPERLRAVVARLCDGRSSAAAWLRVARGRVAARLAATCWRRAVCFAAPPLALLLLPAMGLAYHVFFDRSGLPDIEPFIRFKPPTIGEVYDVRGTVLIGLAREYRRVVSYDEVPPVLRHAILSAEDKNFFIHSGVDYRALPRVLQKTAARSLAAWGTGEAGFRLLLGHGGSTLTQQLVRGYFLQSLTSREGADVLVRGGLTPRLLSAALDERVRRLTEGARTFLETTGDGCLVTFPAVVPALESAVALLRELDERPTPLGAGGRLEVRPAR